MTETAKGITPADPAAAEAAVPPWVTEPDDADIALWEMEGVTPQSGDHWTISDDKGAEWAMAHVAAAEAQIQGAHDSYALWLRQLDDWYTDATKSARRTVLFFSGHLQQYALAKREANPKAKTLRLPSGEVKTRATGDEVIVVDDEKLIDWAQRTIIEPPDEDLTSYADAGVVKVTKEVRVSVLRKLVEIKGDQVLTPQGEVVPGVGVQPAATHPGAVTPVKALRP